MSRASGADVAHGYAVRLLQHLVVPIFVTVDLPGQSGYEIVSYRELANGAHQVANWLMGEVSRRLNAEDRSIDASPVSPAQLGRLISRIGDGTLSNNAARQVFDALWSGEGSDVDAVIEAKGLRQMNDTGALDRILDEVLAANPKSVDEYRAGKDKAFNALVGQVMKASQGKANPAQVNALLKARLG